MLIRHSYRDTKRDIEYVSLLPKGEVGVVDIINSGTIGCGAGWNDPERAE